MRIGNFSLVVQPSRELGSGHVEMEHGGKYALRLVNHWRDRRADALVKIDGKDVGSFRVNSQSTLILERPAHDEGCFTFFAADSPEANASGIANVARDDRGLVEVTFTPEHPIRPVEREEKTSGGLEFENGTLGMFPTSYRSRGITEKSLTSGITGLSGQSQQRFVTVAELNYDHAQQVRITLRLVGVKPVRELTSMPKSNPVPEPIV